MDEELEELRGRYLAELRALMPSLEAWRKQVVERDGQERFDLRWPTGFAGHPQVIDVYRRYYFEIEDLNLDRAEEAEDWDGDLPDYLSEDLWGVEEAGDGPIFYRHHDVLVSDLPEVAPDVAGLVAGMVLVPVGLDDEEEPY